MEKCRVCKHNYKEPEDEPRCNIMCENHSEFEPITNADRIRKMTDEELAEWLHNICHFYDGPDDDVMVSIYNLDKKCEEEIRDSYGDLLNWLRGAVE